MKVFILARMNSETGIIYVYANDEDEAIKVAQSFDETGEWKAIRMLEDFAQIINYEP